MNAIEQIKHAMETICERTEAKRLIISNEEEFLTIRVDWPNDKHAMSIVQYKSIDEDSEDRFVLRALTLKKYGT